MNVYKCYSQTYCRCGKNYGYGTKWNQAYCFGCGVSLVNIMQAKPAKPILLATIRDHEKRVLWGIMDCEHKMGFLFHGTDNYAMCINCGCIADIISVIDEKTGEFISNIIDT